jgi:predicted membrane protein
VNSSETSFRITPRLIVGFGILALGLLWTLDNLDLIESEPITRWWPAVLIVIGLVQLFDRRSNKGAPVLMIIVGAVLLLRRLRLVDIDFGDLIPLAIAALGAKLIWEAVSRRRIASEITGEPDSEITAFAFMSGVKRQSTARDFRIGSASAIMGGVELDLRNAEVSEGHEAVVDAFAMWGGVEIFVPANWRVIGDVFPLMGAFVDKTAPTPGAGPTLRVRGTAVMGGIEVKN